MRPSKNFLTLIVIGLILVSIQPSFAVPSIEMSTSKSVYEYGDYLSITFHVSELTGNQIVLHIVDSSGKTSSPINIPIFNKNSTINSPLPFYKTNYSPGTYHIDAEYSGSTTSVSFDLIDSGKIAIPTEFKTFVKTIQNGTPTDKDYAGFIRELINEKIISVENYNNQTNQIHIPQWFKNSVKWWAEDSVSDNEFGSSIQYLLQKGIIVV